MNKNTVTIYDIAKEAGASPATVSRVLNKSDHPVKPEMRERIME
ncbi:MAG: LacI family DNA-binding transcriptional regulator, partial [Otoolea sp.]